MTSYRSSSQRTPRHIAAKSNAGSDQSRRVRAHATITGNVRKGPPNAEKHHSACRHPVWHRARNPGDLTAADVPIRPLRHELFIDRKIFWPRVSKKVTAKLKSRSRTRSRHLSKGRLSSPHLQCARNDVKFPIRLLHHGLKFLALWLFLNSLASREGPMIWPQKL